MEELGPAGDMGRLWKGKKVFLTGHTGFKGAWLGLWLASMGAEVYGYAFAPPTVPSPFTLGRVQSLFSSSTLADVRDAQALKETLVKARPEIVIHMAAQPLVRQARSGSPARPAALP
jgi:CDP-glucose 4,6-dehydratase